MTTPADDAREQAAGRLDCRDPQRAEEPARILADRAGTSSGVGRR